MKIENFDQLKVFNKNFNRQRRQTIRNRIRATAVKKKPFETKTTPFKHFIETFF